MKKATAIILFVLFCFFVFPSTVMSGQKKQGADLSEYQKKDLVKKTESPKNLSKKLKQLEKKKEKSSPKGYCCRNGRLSKQKLEESRCKGSFIDESNSRLAKLSCLMLKKGYCCGEKAEVYKTTYGTCKNNGGQFFDKKVGAETSCEKKITGYCCSGGKVDRKKVTSQECLKKRVGQFYKNIGYQSAKKRCEQTVTGYCLRLTFLNKNKQYSLEKRILEKDCKKQNGIFYHDKAKALNGLRYYKKKLARDTDRKRLSDLNRRSMGMAKKNRGSSHSGIQIGVNKPTKEPKKKPIDIHTNINAERFRIPDDDSPTSDECEMVLTSPADTSNVSSEAPLVLEVVLTGCEGVDRVEFLLDNFDYKLSGIDYFQTDSASASPYRVVLPAPPPGDNINAWATAFDDDLSSPFVKGLSFGISTTAPNKPKECELRIISPIDGHHYNPDSPQSTVIGVKGCKSMTRLVLTTHGPAWGTHHWVLTDKNLCSAQGSSILGGGSSLLSGEKSYCLGKPRWQPPESTEYPSTLYANAWKGVTRLLAQTSARFYVDDNTRVFNGTFRLP